MVVLAKVALVRLAKKPNNLFALNCRKRSPRRPLSALLRHAGDEFDAGSTDSLPDFGVVRARRGVPNVGFHLEVSSEVDLSFGASAAFLRLQRGTNRHVATPVTSVALEWEVLEELPLPDEKRRDEGALKRLFAQERTQVERIPRVATRTSSRRPSDLERSVRKLSLCSTRSASPPRRRSSGRLTKRNDRRHLPVSHSASPNTLASPGQFSVPPAIEAPAPPLPAPLPLAIPLKNPASPPCTPPPSPPSVLPSATFILDFCLSSSPSSAPRFLPIATLRSSSCCATERGWAREGMGAEAEEERVEVVEEREGVEEVGGWRESWMASSICCS